MDEEQAPLADARYLTDKRSVLLRFQDWKCYYCGRTLTRKQATLDHLVPPSKGGRNEMENYAITCGRCNEAKGNLTEDEFLEWILAVYHHYVDGGDDD